MNNEEKEKQMKLLEKKNKILEKDITEILKFIAPGTSLRNAMEGIQKAKTGALIVVYNDFVEFEGGFKINSRFTPQRLIELSKMDGGIILSKDLKKILYANVLLIPDTAIFSKETGTRHKAAERTAKQANTMVIAISQRKGEISLFYKEKKYIVKETNDIIRRSTEVLQILEKHKEVFERNKRDLDREELKKKPKLNKALLLIQRGIIILKISKILRDYLIELGIEGTIVKSRLKEILYGVEKEICDVIKDYSPWGVLKSKKFLTTLSYEDLLELDNVKKCLGLSGLDITFSKGYRILEKAGIFEKDIGKLIKQFKNLISILDLKKEEIILFFEDEKADIIIEKISHIKEQSF